MGSSESNEAEHLGEDIICEISSRMPAKSSIKFLSLSKSLSTIPSDPLFVERQSIHSSRFHGGFFLQSNRMIDKLEFHVLLKRDGDSPSTFGIPSDSLSFLENNGRVVGSSHGLLLLRVKDKQYHDYKLLICNPAIRRWAFLPNPDKSLLNLARMGLLLECHPNYWIEVEDDPIKSKVFGLTVYHNGKWEEVTRDLRIPGRHVYLNKPVALFRGCNGGIIMHYLCDSIPCRTGGPVFQRPYLVTYDIDRKAYSRTLNLPEDAWKEEEDHENGSYPLKIFKWRSSAAGETMGLLRKDKGMLRVWVLEDYEQGGWRRVLTKTTAEIGVPEEEGIIVKGYCVMNGTELAFATVRLVYVYHMEGPHAGRLETVAEHGYEDTSEVYFTSYANTLRPVCCGESSVLWRV